MTRIPGDDLEHSMFCQHDLCLTISILSILLQNAKVGLTTGEGEGADQDYEELENKHLRTGR